MYYLVKHYDMKTYKTIVDITMVIILYLNGKRMYRLLNQPLTQMQNEIEMENIPIELKLS